MRLSSRLLSLVAGSAVTALGCGGSQAPAVAVPAQPAPVQIAQSPSPNTNQPVTTPTPATTPVASYPTAPEDIPVDCGRG